MTPKEYVEAINEKIQIDDHAARELSYRGILEDFIKSFGVKTVNEARHRDCGAPDITVYNQNQNVIGFIETKDIDDEDLDGKRRNKKQFNRYKDALGNLIFTDYLDFHFYNGQEFVDEIRIGKLVKDKIVYLSENEDKFLSYIKKFTCAKPQKITSTTRLAEVLAHKAQLIQQTIAKALTTNGEECDSFRRQIDIFKRTLIHDLDDDKFADIYAQTITYGLFVARMHDDSPENFSREEAIRLLPSTNPFLQEMFELMVGTKMRQSLKWIVDDLVSVLGGSDLRSVLKKYGAQQDVVLHFYEDFLSIYSPALRNKLGVFYTPKPVVNFIVRAVDHILKTDFKLSGGIANADTIEHEETQKFEGKEVKVQKEMYKVQILDPALGTGTFLAEVIEQIYAKFANNKAAWQSYVDECLLERLNGFEYMMSPHTMAHIKLGNLLEETGWRNNGNKKRLNVYLTNSLEEGIISDRQLGLFEEAIAKESEMANHIKTNCPVMCVIGNPPYAGVSQNNGKWINNLISEYRREPGKNQKLQERKSWLNADYVKFIRLAERYVSNNKTGIVGFINNNAFLDNITYRGMRWHLLHTFDKVYIINLHGCSLVGGADVCPNGSPDENVFNITVGVSINIFIKTGEKNTNKLGDVYYCDLYGNRQAKFDWLNNHSFDSIEFKAIETTSPYYFFVPKETTGQNKYEQGFSITELMPVNVSGIVTMGDGFAIAQNKEELRTRLLQVKNGEITKAQLDEAYCLGKNYGDFVIKGVKQLTISDDLFVPISFKQFDERITYFSNKVLWRPRIKVMSNMLKDNLAIIVSRQCSEDWKHIFITDKISNFNITGTAGSYGSGFVFPLYIYDGTIRRVNFAPAIVSKFEEILGKEIKPLDLFDYVYGVLHSPHYRARFNEFLKIGYPRIPYPKKHLEYEYFVKIGGQLRQLHLLQNVNVNPNWAKMETTGSNIVTECSYNQGRVYINKEQYFENVPEEAWNFRIGGYQTAREWLMDREKPLGWRDLEHYQKIITVLMETKRIMEEIDK